MAIEGFTVVAPFDGLCRVVRPSDQFIFHMKPANGCGALQTDGRLRLMSCQPWLVPEIPLTQAASAAPDLERATWNQAFSIGVRLFNAAGTIERAMASSSSCDGH